MKAMVKIPEPKKTTTSAIYQHYEDQRDEKQRGYLGPSVLGHECERALWYGFRWATKGEEFGGRKLRLFATGHREEARVIDDLRAIGMEVDGQQIEIIALAGHFRGHVDGIVRGVIEAPKTAHVLEIKTHNEKSYAALFKSGVKKSKPAHYAQMQLYMHHLKIERALYVAVNKNDDQIYTERVRYEKVFSERLMERAARIVRTYTPPPKLHPDPSAREAFICGWCAFKGVCHEGEFAERNCRTCLSATPILDDPDDSADLVATEGGKWHCGYHNMLRTRAEQEAGCSKHLYLPGLVPGEQVNAEARHDGQLYMVTYLLKDGKEWIDGVAYGVV
jgi:CRISPR/Cas system-associated exonuclease Cas4 (RecB family)